MENKDISHLRKSYDKSKLNLNDINFQPMEFFKLWFEDALKNKNIEEANAMTLTTLGLDNFPKGRVVLLKSFTEEGFIFFTNYKSEKGVSIDHHSKVGLSFFWPQLERQVIIKGEIEKISPEDSDNYFSSRPKGSQISALISDQSKVIKSREILEEKMDMMEKEYIRKEIKRPNNWGGYLVKPKAVEFWQGRPNRLHDRILCTLVKNSWDIKRLSP
ncbi:MAG: pyridoxamine 5'-phosphate oxidase [Flavobacteriaceae bacterium]